MGHKFNLSELAFIEPQAEVIYGRVVGDDFTASNGTRFSQKDYDSLIGRLGAVQGSASRKTRAISTLASRLFTTSKVKLKRQP